MPMGQPAQVRAGMTSVGRYLSPPCYLRAGIASPTARRFPERPISGTAGMRTLFPRRDTGIQLR